MSAQVIEFAKPQPPAPKQKSNKPKARKDDARENDVRRLKTMQEVLERAKWDVEAAQERVRHLAGC
jgi:hypothetical protein